MRRSKSLVLAVAATLWTSAAGFSQPFFTVTSSSIKDGARIPVMFGADDPKRACSPRNPAICPCPGKNVSPQLKWS
ncbi:MAG: hypothetical protein V4647_12640, partial [Pseudomonadota bacterium]